MNRGFDLLFAGIGLAVLLYLLAESAWTYWKSKSQVNVKKGKP